jgi:hypothetical protein
MRTLILGLAAATFSTGLAFAQTAQTNGTAAASGNDNQAVATTTANAPTPAKGHNSFSRGEARRRLASHGFIAVANLHKDANGIWRASATHNGTPTDVWLDYKGNVGAGQS